MIKRIIHNNLTGETYCFNFQLKSTHKDIGFFDTYEINTGNTITATTVNTITGYSTSRLEELRKYVVTGSLSEIYVTSTQPSVDGLNVSLTTTGVSDSTYVYYIGGITYSDLNINGSTTTHFIFESLGLNDTNNFDNQPYIKLEEKQNIVENPNVTKDVNVIRQEIPVFEQIMRLRGIDNLNDILVYGGGKVFTVHNNT